MKSDNSTRNRVVNPAEGREDSTFDPFDLFDDGHPGAIRFERMIETDSGAVEEGLSCSVLHKGDCSQ